MKEGKNQVITLVLILVLAMVVISGSTFAFFSAAATNSSGVSGRTAKFDVTLNMTTTKSGTLIPADDSNIITFLNGANACQDSRGYDACSIYQITLANTGTVSSTMNGYFITTTSAESNNFKYALYTMNNNTYTIASDVGTVSMSSSTKNYFKSNSTNMTFALNSNQTTNYYLVVWLSNIDSNQISDQNKTYSGKIFFESTAGMVSANFT